MPTIDVLTERVEPVTTKTLVSAVFARFQREPDTLVLPVVDDHRPLGLIERHDFMMKLAGPLGHSLYGSREVVHIMDPEPPVVEYNVRIDAFSDIILKNTSGAMMRGFIVTRNGNYRGVGTAVDLLRAVNESQRQQIQDLNSEIAALSDQTRQAQDAARANHQFLGLLNRELRTPMNGVLAVADLLLRQPLNEAALAYVQTIIDSSESLLATLQDSLDLAHAETGDLTLTPQPHRLQDLMDQVQDQWVPRATEDGVSLIVSYDGASELAALIDPIRIKQVINSMIAQALRYARSGMVEVSLKARETGDCLKLEARIRDDGPGIPADLIDGLFSSGTTTQPSTMNLAISRHLITQMKGRIWAENNRGSGSTLGFDLVVPRAEIEIPPATNVSSLRDLELTARPHVLIADDNATNRVVAQALCEMFGCTSETVEDGQDAFEAVQNRPFDLILMDIKMPRLDGVQATLAIRRLNGPVAGIPIIALTANADPDDAQHYLNVGMAAVVEKPIKPERLRKAMNAALSNDVDHVADAGQMSRRNA
jgi:signal transduction histidine kinase/ActR/RegA family two-component response regulator